jgi:hypothetical protein
LFLLLSSFLEEIFFSFLFLCLGTIQEDEVSMIPGFVS